MPLSATVPGKWDQRLLVFCGHPMMVVVVWLMLIIANADQKIRQNGFFSGTVLDTDSFMHLTRHLAGGWWRSGGWTDRINTPFGAVVHWTYPYDIFLGFAALPLRMVMDKTQAIAVAGSWSSALASLIVMLLLHDLGRRVRGPIAGLILATLYMSAMPIFLYSSIGRADHHILTILFAVLFLVFLVRAVLQQNKILPAFAGIWGGLGIWTAPEILPVLSVGTGLFLGWHISMRLPFLRIYSLAGLTITLICMAGLVLDPPYDGLLSPDSDRISIVFVMFGGVLTMVMFGASYFNDYCARPCIRMILIALIALLGAVLWLSCFPNALTGPIGHVSPVLQKEWLGLISEMQPIQSPSRFCWYLAYGVFGFLAAMELARKCWSSVPEKGIFMMFCAGAIFLSIVGGMLASRLCYFAVIAGILPIVLWWCETKDKWWVWRVYIILGIIILPIITGNLASRIADAYGYTRWNDLVPKSTQYCRDLASVKSILPQTSVSLMAPQNIGPRILWETPHKIVGAPFHRNEQGILDDLSFYRSDDPAVINHIARSRHIELALVCYSTSEPLRGWIQNVAAQQIVVPEWQIIATVAADEGKTIMSVLSFRP